MPKDAIRLLKDDHDTVEALFKRFEKLGDGATRSKRQIGDRIIKELAIHAVIEEQVFYPVIRECDGEIEKLVLEALEEHHIAKWTLSELDGMDPEHERYDAKFSVLMESVRHHVKEEERTLFPKVRKNLTREMLDELGKGLASAKRAAPTHPHPRSPDTPPGNVVAGGLSAVTDRLRDFVRGVRDDAERAANSADRKASARSRSRNGSTSRASATARKAATKTARKTTGKATRKATATRKAAKRAAR